MIAALIAPTNPRKPIAPIPGLIFSEEDSDLHNLRWRLDKDGYARTNVIDGGKRKTMFAHHIVVQRYFGRRPDWSIREVVDHIDRTKLNNSRDNLRITTLGVNARNRDMRVASRVTKHNCGQWQSQVQFMGKSFYLGLFRERQNAEYASMGAVALIKRVSIEAIEAILAGADYNSLNHQS